MIKRILPALALFLVACASGTASMPPQLIPPEVGIEQIGRIQDGAARNVQGGMTVNLRVSIINRSSEELRVERIDVTTRGSGAYTVPRASRPFDRILPQDRLEELDLWVPTTTNNTIVGVGGPVTLQLTVYFVSPYGKFREVYTRDINTSQVKGKDE